MRSTNHPTNRFQRATHRRSTDPPRAAAARSEAGLELPEDAEEGEATEDQPPDHAPELPGDAQSRESAASCRGPCLPFLDVLALQPLAGMGPLVGRPAAEHHFRAHLGSAELVELRRPPHPLSFAPP